MNKTKYIRTESEEQQMLFRYCSVEAWRYPQLETLMHVPNESRRSVAYGAKLKREGMRKGYPDITLFAGSRMKDGSCYHALMIELKRIKGSSKTQEQKHWIKMLNKYEYAAAFCYGHEEAWELIKAYLDGDNEIVRAYIERSLKEAE